MLADFHAPGRPRDRDTRASYRVLAYAAGLGLAYAALSKLVIEITSFGATTGSSFWPGAGLTVAVLLLRPRREWPWLLLGVAIAEATIDLWAGFGPWLALGWAVANTAEPTVAAWLLTRKRTTSPDLADRKDLARFIAAAVLAGPLIGALIGTAVAALAVGDPWLPRLPRWWVGDGLGVLVLAPLLLVTLGGVWKRPSTKSAWPLVLLLITSVAALGPWAFPAKVGLPFLVPPILVLVALTLRTPGAAVGVLIVAAIVETVTALGSGPFAHAGAFDGLVVAQMFLVMSALTALAVAALMSDLVSRDEVEATLRAQAMHDRLTGLPNRRLLLNRLELASQRLARRPGMLTLLFVDVDDFKRVNDTLGHAAGDQVLAETGRRLRSVVRDEDTVARIGGDEFVMLAESITRTEDAHALAERALRAIEAPYQWSGHSVSIVASVGLATAHEPPADIETFLNGADRAMYEAKRGGGTAIGRSGRLCLAAAAEPKLTPTVPA